MKKKIIIPILITATLVVSAAFKLQSNKRAVDENIYRIDRDTLY